MVGTGEEMGLVDATLSGDAVGGGSIAGETTLSTSVVVGRAGRRNDENKLEASRRPVEIVVSRASGWPD